MAFDDTKTKQANEELEKRLLKDRNDWKDNIQRLVQKLKSLSNLAECQVEMLSYRQILLDKIIDLKHVIYKRNASWEKYYKSLYRDYTLNYDIKLTAGEKNQFIKADLGSLKNQVEILQSHIDYYQECIRTLDNMAFAIKNRIKLEDDYS